MNNSARKVILRTLARRAVAETTREAWLVNAVVIISWQRQFNWTSSLEVPTTTTTTTTTGRNFIAASSWFYSYFNARKNRNRLPRGERAKWVPVLWFREWELFRWYSLGSSFGMFANILTMGHHFQLTHQKVSLQTNESWSATLDSCSWPEFVRSPLWRWILVIFMICHHYPE